MRFRPPSLSVLFLAGLLAAGSTALGYYYYFFYEPPLAAGEGFIRAMEMRDISLLRDVVIMSDSSLQELRDPTDQDLEQLVMGPFNRGRILDQRKRTGANRDYHYLVYREPDGTIYALLVTKIGEKFRVVISERPYNPRAPYLWEYTWTN